MTRVLRPTVALLLLVSACVLGDLPGPPQVGDAAPDFQAVSLEDATSPA